MYASEGPVNAFRRYRIVRFYCIEFRCFSFNAWDQRRSNMVHYNISGRVGRLYVVLYTVSSTVSVLMYHNERVFITDI